MAKSTHLRARYGSNILESVTDSTTADRASIKLRPGATDRLDGTARLKGAMMIPLSRISADPEQPRKEFVAEELNRLAASIKTRGVLSPIRVRWDDLKNVWIIVAGERRWRACVLLGLEQIPAVEVSTAAPEDLLADQLVENCVRSDLTPIEQAKAIRQLLDMTGRTQSWVAEELGISKGQISKVLSLLETPREVQQKVEAGELAVAAAVELARVPQDAAVAIARQGGDSRAIRKKAEQAGAVTHARTSRYEDRFDDVSVIVTVKRPDVERAEYEKILRKALTRLKSDV